MRIALTPIAIFQDKTVPDRTRLAGWAALVQALSLRRPVRRPCVVSEQHIRGSYRQEGEWNVFDKRYWPGDTFGDHLSFALRHQQIGPLILKRVFEAAPKDETETLIRTAPWAFRRGGCGASMRP